MFLFYQAINIATSCKLLSPEMEPVFIINGETHDEVFAQVAYAISNLKRRREQEGQEEFGLVVTGSALRFPLKPTKRERDDDIANHWTKEILEQQRELELKFLVLAKQCSAVVCCRVSPLQKAKVVDLVKTNEGVIFPRFQPHFLFYGVISVIR